MQEQALENAEEVLCSSGDVDIALTFAVAFAVDADAAACLLTKSMSATSRPFNMAASVI